MREGRLQRTLALFLVSMAASPRAALPTRTNPLEV